MPHSTRPNGCRTAEIHTLFATNPAPKQEIMFAPKGDASTEPLLITTLRAYARVLHDEFGPAEYMLFDTLSGPGNIVASIRCADLPGENSFETFLYACASSMYPVAEGPTHEPTSISYAMMQTHRRSAFHVDRKTTSFPTDFVCAIEGIRLTMHDMDLDRIFSGLDIWASSFVVDREAASNITHSIGTAVPVNVGSQRRATI